MKEHWVGTAKIVVGCWKGESEEFEGLHCGSDRRIMLARNYGSEISVEYVGKWLKLFTEVFDKDKKDLTSIILLIFVHVGLPALWFAHCSRKTSRSR